MLLQGEKLIDVVSTHWMKYFRPTLVLLITVPFAVFLLYLPVSGLVDGVILSHVFFFAGTSLLILATHWGFHRLLSEAMVDIIITNRRIVYLCNTLLTQDIMREYHMERLRTVEGEKDGFSENIFGYGTLTMSTEGGGGEDARIDLVPKPNELSQQIINAMEESGVMKIHGEENHESDDDEDVDSASNERRSSSDANDDTKKTRQAPAQSGNDNSSHPIDRQAPGVKSADDSSGSQKNAAHADVHDSHAGGIGASRNAKVMRMPSSSDKRIGPEANASSDRRGNRVQSRRARWRVGALLARMRDKLTGSPR